MGHGGNQKRIHNSLKSKLKLHSCIQIQTSSFSYSSHPLAIRVSNGGAAYASGVTGASSVKVSFTSKVLSIIPKIIKTDFPKKREVLIPGVPGAHWGPINFKKRFEKYLKI